MQKYADVVLDRNGNVVANAIILVKNQDGSAATIYSDRNGLTPRLNPLTADSLGRFSFYAANGRYDIDVISASVVRATITDILLEDPLDKTAENIDGGEIRNVALVNPTIDGDAPVKTKADIGLGNVDNTSDADKPVSAPQAEAIQLVANAASAAQNDIDSYKTLLSGASGATQIGIGGGRTQADKNAEIVSPLDFGATGDGVTDDTAAFLAAEAIADQIYIPGGTYIVSGALSKRYFGPGIVILNGVTFQPASASQDIGANNTLTGRNAGTSLTTGTFNTLIGVSAGRNITSGTKNVYLGINGGSGNAALPALPAMTGSDNIGIGYHALKKCQSGSMNVGIGTDAGNEITTGNDNTCVGGSAGQQLTIGSDNTIIGKSAALRLGTDASANPSDATTWVALAGTGNTAVGRDSLRNGYNCSRNTVIGYQAMRGTKDETNLTGNIAGSDNVVIGYQAMYTGPTTAAANTTVGAQSGKSLVAGSNNVMLGHEAGRDVEGSGNIIIGYRAYRSFTSANNKLIIANQSSTAFVDGDMVGPLDGSNLLRVDAVFRPAGDNTRALGSAVGRWSVVYAGTGTINTSDGREKTDPLPIDDAVLDAWGDVHLITFQWLDAVHQKGEDVARWHFGVIAQQVRDAFDAHGLDGTRYGLLCYDEWGAQDEVRDDDGNVVQEGREAGNRWGIRADQCLFLEAAYQRRRVGRIESRLAALESGA